MAPMSKPPVLGDLLRDGFCSFSRSLPLAENRFLLAPLPDLLGELPILPLLL